MIISITYPDNDSRISRWKYHEFSRLKHQPIFCEKKYQPISWWLKNRSTGLDLLGSFHHEFGGTFDLLLRRRKDIVHLVLCHPTMATLRGGRSYLVTYLTAPRLGIVVGISICGCGFWRNGTTHVVRKGKFKEFLGQSGFPYLDSNGAIRHIHCPFVLPEVKLFSNLLSHRSCWHYLHTDR